MCGLVGMAGRITKQNIKVFENLLIMDQLRGTHSVGVGFVGEDGSAGYLKHTVTPATYLKTEEYKERVKDPEKIYALIGHNRYATQGKVNSTNAHPFLHGKILGAHNGTLRGQWRLEDHKDFEVDSENIIHSLNKVGVKETVSKLDGAYALSWWNVEEKTLNFIRNSERPLHFYRTTSDQTIFWASEKEMLYAALVRNRIYGVKLEDIKPLPVNELHTYDMPRHQFYPSGYRKPLEMEKPIVEKLEGFKFVPTHSHHSPKKTKAKQGKVTPITKNKGGKNQKKRLPPTYELLEELGLKLGDDIYWYPEEVNGNLVEGTLFHDYSTPVVMRVKDPQVAKDIVEDGMPLRSQGIVAVHSKTTYNPKGKLTVSLGKVTTTTWEELFSVVGTKGEEEKKIKCAWCMDDVKKDDMEQLEVGTDTVLCGDCAMDESIICGYLALPDYHTRN